MVVVDFEFVCVVGIGIVFDGDELGEWFSIYWECYVECIVYDFVLVCCFVVLKVSVFDCGVMLFLFMGVFVKFGYDVVGVDFVFECFVGVIEELKFDVCCCDIECELLLFDEVSVDFVVFNEFFEYL